MAPTYEHTKLDTHTHKATNNNKQIWENKNENKDEQKQTIKLKEKILKKRNTAILPPYQGSLAMFSLHKSKKTNNVGPHFGMGSLQK